MHGSPQIIALSLSNNHILVDFTSCKVAVFAVRLDTYPIPERTQVFYIGTNSSKVLGRMRRDILSQFKHLPTSGEYLHRDCYDAAKKYSKDTFIVIDKLGADFIPKLFEFKRIVDLIARKLKFFLITFQIG